VGILEGYIFSFNSEDQEGILYGTNGIPYFFKAVDVDSPAKIASQVKVEFSSFTDGTQRIVARMIKIQESNSFKNETPHSSAAKNAGISSGGIGSSNNYADAPRSQGHSRRPLEPSPGHNNTFTTAFFINRG
jgi:hypothetical protein